MKIRLYRSKNFDCQLFSSWKAGMNEKSRFTRGAYSLKEFLNIASIQVSSITPTFHGYFQGGTICLRPPRCGSLIYSQEGKVFEKKDICLRFIPIFLRKPLFRTHPGSNRFNPQIGFIALIQIHLEMVIAFEYVIFHSSPFLLQCFHHSLAGSDH